jgi:hypothetical protein
MSTLRTGPCKTESSQKAIPLDPYLAEALRAWLEHVRYNRPEDWVFANPGMKGRQPYWGQEIMRRVIRPIRDSAGNHQTHWVAHLPAHVFDPSAGKQEGSRGYLRGESLSLSAMWTNSAKELASIFCMTWPLWIFTVASLAPISEAICLIEHSGGYESHNLALSHGQ